MGSGASVVEESERIDESQNLSQANDSQTSHSEVLKSDYLRGSMMIKTVPKDILTVSCTVTLFYILEL